MPQKQNKNLSPVFSPYKASKSISDLIFASNGEKWILKRVRNFQIWVKSFKKKIQNFSKDFNVKSREKTKLKKKQKIQFFSKKKMIFLFFFQFVFFHGNRQIGPKIS